MSRYGPKVSDLSTFSCFQHKTIDRPWERKQRKFDDWFLSTDIFNDSTGCIRWSFIRSAYFSGIADLDLCVMAYREWRDTREDLWLDAVGSDGSNLGTVLVAAAKRGNEWYKKRLNRKFSFFEELPPIHFFCEEWGHKSTPMLFLTLTVDPSFVKNNLNQAWDQIGLELHVFETKLRQEYGPFVKLRVWEAHGSGYPHCHVVYYFHNHRFEVWEHFDKKKGRFTGNRSFRVSDGDRDRIQSFWRLSSPIKVIDGVAKRVPSVDIQGVSDTLGALSEVRKYVTKAVWNKKGDLTNTLCCLHRKQAYWISQNDYRVKFKQSLLKMNSDTEAAAKYVDAHIDQWACKDFIGAIWGSEAYRSYWLSLEDNELSVEGLGALVKDRLHNCNVVVDHFELRGCFKHEDLNVLLPISDAEIVFVDPPPDDVRILLGVDRVCLSGDYSRSFGRSKYFDDLDLEVD